MRAPFAGLVSLLGITPPAPGEMEVLGTDPVFPCRFPLAGMAAAALAACGLAASELWGLRNGRRQDVRISVRHAGASLLSFAFLRAPGGALPHVSPTTALYPTRAGRFIHLHGGFPHLADGTLRILGCREEREAIAAAVARWDPQDLEDALAEARLCGAMVRSAAEWASHPQGKALATLPVLEVTRIGDADPQPLARARRPLEGIRALDLTRVLAGPTCGRSLAEHGADVLRITCPRLPDVLPFVIDTGNGKLSADLDLDAEEDVRRLRSLAAGADVFVGGYRSGSLERRGFGAAELAALRPRIVYVSINCYGREGPWRERAGWEQLAQSVTGLAHDHGGTKEPQLERGGVASYETTPERSVIARARARGVPPGEVILDALLASDLRALVMVALHNGDMRASAAMMVHPLSTPGLGDAGAHTSQTCDVGVGTFTLAYWARDRGLLTIEDAIRKLTFGQALVWGILGRGLVRPGWAADLNVIDLDQLDLELPELRHDLPGGAPNLSQRARGYTATVVNGAILLRDGEHSGGVTGTREAA